MYSSFNKCYVVLRIIIIALRISLYVLQSPPGKGETYHVCTYSVAPARIDVDWNMMAAGIDTHNLQFQKLCRRALINLKFRISDLKFYTELIAWDADFFFFYTWRCVGVAGSSCNEELDVVGSCCNEELDVVESSCNQTRYCMMFLQPWNRWIIIIAATTRCRVFMQTRTRCYRNFLQQQADVIGTSYNNELDVVGSFCKNKLHGVWTFCNHELDIAGYSCKNE